MNFFKKQTIQLCALWAALFVGDGRAAPGEGVKGDKPMICLSACADALPESGPLFYPFVPKETKIEAYLPCTFTPSSLFPERKPTGRLVGIDAVYGNFFTRTLINEKGSLKKEKSTTWGPDEGYKKWFECQGKRSFVAVFGMGSSPMDVHLSPTEFFHLLARVVLTEKNTSSIREKAGGLLIDLVNRQTFEEELTAEKKLYLFYRLLDAPNACYDLEVHPVTSDKRELLEQEKVRLSTLKDTSSDATIKEDIDTLLESLDECTGTTRRINMHNYDVWLEGDVLPKPSKEALEAAQKVFDVESPWPVYDQAVDRAYYPVFADKLVVKLLEAAFGSGPVDFDDRL